MPVTLTKAKWVSGILTYFGGAVNFTEGLQVGGVAMSGAVRGGSYTVVTADDTAGTLDIDTGLTTVSSFVVQIFRAGVPIFSDQAVSESGGTLTIADGGATYALTADDVINWIAVGS